jgi:hypothetical protein
MKNGKRIEKVVVKTMMDSDGDTSYLGEYSNSPNSDFSIDRAHDLDCPQQPFNEAKRVEAVEQLERVIAYLETVRNLGEPPENIYWAAADESQDMLVDLQRDIEEECTCESAGWQRYRRSEYKYFNPNHENYAGCEHDAIVKYCIQDFERMEDLNNGGWWYVGVRAEAKILLPRNANDGKPNNLTFQSQTITSGGLWGIESDSDNAYIEEVTKDELADLREQLKQLGFSSRAISKAFQSIEYKDGN